jgi:hypothetical protein
MAAPNEKLAASLAVLRKLQKDGQRVFKSNEFSRINRARLVRNGFLQEVMKGWLISSHPGADAGDSTPWYACFWEFCARYCEGRFAGRWLLSPEQSLLLHTEKTVVPPQVVVYSPGGSNHRLELPFGTSLYDLKQEQLPPAADLTVRDGLRLFTPAAALIRVSEAFFAANPVETRVALAGLRDISDLLRGLLEGGRSVVAGRLAGAFRRVGRPDAAAEILTTMEAAGYDVRESDPFAGREWPAFDAAPPIVGRMKAMWESTRRRVIDVFPAPPGLPRNRQAYLKGIDELYRTDAYHSLSIEGYKVSAELVERVRAGNWNPERSETDRQSRDALAARGYWQAFQVVKADIGEIVAGANPGRLVRTAHRDWHRELFQPCVAAGLVSPAALAGYRKNAVYLRASRFVPPRWEVVRDAMAALFDLLENEPEPSVRAVLGHWLFGYVHPYADGNWRMARFVMNAMLASGGYPWTVVHVEDRGEYLAALDRASIDLDITSFSEFLAACVRRSVTQG